MSQQTASSTPAPMQARWMVAMTGMRSASTAVKQSWRRESCSRMTGRALPGEASRPSWLRVEPALTSRPAQKQPPAPIRTATLTSGAASTARQASPMPSHISKSSALSRSGLLSVMVATGALISTCTLSVIEDSRALGSPFIPADSGNVPESLGETAASTHAPPAAPMRHPIRAVLTGRVAVVRECPALLGCGSTVLTFPVAAHSHDRRQHGRNQLLLAFARGEHVTLAHAHRAPGPAHPSPRDQALTLGRGEEIYLELDGEHLGS